MSAPFFSILGSALSIWEHKLANKYFEEWKKLMRVRHEENKKPLETRDMVIIDNAEFELFLLGRRYQAQVGRPDPTDKS